MTLSARASRALSLLREGGEMVIRLEPNYHGGQTWMTRFRSKEGGTAKGLGIKTRFELEAAGIKFELKNSTSVSSYYELLEG